MDKCIGYHLFVLPNIVIKESSFRIGASLKKEWIKFARKVNYNQYGVWEFAKRMFCL